MTSTMIYDNAVSFRKATGHQTEQNVAAPLRLREAHPNASQFKHSAAIIHGIPGAQERLALEMLQRCDGPSPLEVQDAHSLEYSTLQSNVDTKRDRDLDALSHIANSGASQTGYSYQSSPTEVMTGAAHDAHESDGLNHMANVSPIDFLVHVGSQFIQPVLTPRTLSQQEGGDRFETASIGDGEDMNLGVDGEESTYGRDSTKQRISANYQVVIMMQTIWTYADQSAQTK
jgi:hypothetical protein